MKPTPGPWKNESMHFSMGWHCIVELPGQRCISLADPRDRDTDAEDVANAELVATAPVMLRLLKDVWIEKLNEKAIPGTISEEIRNLLTKFEMLGEPNLNPATAQTEER